MLETLQDISSEYVVIPIRTPPWIGDPTSDPVAAAFIADNTKPGDDDWIDGTWSTVPPDDHWPYAILVQAGPDADTQLVVGRYTVWIRITDDPEIVIRPVGAILVK